MHDPIVQDGDPVLRQAAKPVAAKDIASPKIQKLIAKMQKILADEEYGVALAAPQVGEPLRLFVIASKAFEPAEDYSPKKSSDLLSEPSSSREGSAGQTFSRNNPPSAHLVFINPELLRLSRKKAEMSEGCLSVRGKYGTVLRHEKATVKALDERGKPFTYHGTGLVAHIFQHECDHLNGILYTDKAVKLEEDEDMRSARKKLKEKHGV